MTSEGINSDFTPGKAVWLFLNSLSLFLIAYIIIYVVSGLSTLYIAYDMDIPAKMFPKSVVFDLADDSPLWTTDAIVSVFMATPFVCLMMGLASLMVYQHIPRMTTSILFFLIWLFLHAFNLSFGLFSEDLIMGQGVARVADIFGFNLAVSVVSIGFSSYFLIRAGNFAGKMLANSMNMKLIDTFKRRAAVWFWSFLLPWIIGGSFLLLSDYEHIAAKELILLGFLLLIILPIPFVRHMPTAQDQVCVIPNKLNIIVNVLVAGTSYLALHYFLGEGISLG